MPKTAELWFVNGRGKKVTRTINLSIDIEEFRGRAGYVWLLMAGNPRLSASDILAWINSTGETGSLRSETWIRTRRWMFQDPDSVGVKRNADGLDDRAFSIMARYPTLSARKLAVLLKEHGITRGRTWVRMNRCR